MSQSIYFDKYDRLQAAAECIRVLYQIVGLSADEIKELLTPDMVDATIKVLEARKHER